MVKLSADVIQDSMQYFNPSKERELSLRSNKIPSIENIGATNNQFDVIDFTDNDIKRLENFPLLPRLKSLLMSNNRIGYIQPDLSKYLPNITQLILINNNLQELGDIMPLKGLQKLTHLSLMSNPVAHNSNYRYFIIHQMPQVRVLDFKRIKQKERKDAKQMFTATPRGKTLLTSLIKSTTQHAPVEEPDEVASSIIDSNVPVKSAEDLAKIKAAIANAKTLNEVEHLQSILASGQVPGKTMLGRPHANGVNGSADMEEDDDAGTDPSQPPIDVNNLHVQQAQDAAAQ